MWYKIFYLLSVADNLITVLWWFAILSTLMFVVWSILNLCSIDSTSDIKNTLNTKYKKFWYYTICIFMMLSWIGLVLVPSKKDCLMIIAGGSVGNFITSDSSATAIPSDITKFLHLSLQNEINSLGEETKAELGLLSPKEKMLNDFKDLTKEQIIRLLQSDTSLIK